ncbi:hypothetical protein BDN72DRAFT_97175 [Pluteus cervinus]|uniref:Uncharacterized protein n=1 Tax=Pluteus cervinus TaxID=181527 RepID=A0ACD3ANE4_9AGAR|nr:hypothetical protein BDN72DRAFT_97175 [Pluteus cervinus]
MILPVELIDSVLDYVGDSFSATEMSTTLRACSLVCRFWRALVQPILYARFTRYRRSYHNAALIKSLVEHKHLQNYVKTLWVDASWFQTTDRERELLFALLPEVQELGMLQNGYHLSGLINYPHVFPGVVVFGNLTRLTLQGINDFPIDLFNRFDALQDLFIRSTILVGFSPTTGEPLNSNTLTTSHPQLRLLHISINRSSDVDACSWLQHPDCVFSLSGVKTLHISDYTTWGPLNDHQKKVLGLMSCLSSSVEDLIVHPPNSEPVYPYSQYHVGRLNFHFL